MATNETLSEIIVFGLVLASAGFFYLLNLAFEKIPPKQKNTFLLLGFLTSPAWASLTLLFLAWRVPLAATGNVDPLLDLFALGLSLLLIYVYFLLANFPATLSHAISMAWREHFYKKKVALTTKSFWPQLHKLRQHRLVVLLILLILLLILVVANFLLILAAPLNYALLTLGFLLIIFSLVLEIFQSKKITIGEVTHQKLNLTKKLAENLSLAAGITPPQVKILSHTNPAAFSLYSNFNLKQPTIYLTTGLLNLADKRELEAVLAHEVAHIFSGWVFNHHLMDNLLIALRFFSFLLLLAFLTAVNPILLSIWLAALFYVSVGGSLDSEGWPGNLGSLSKTAAALANPPFVLLNFLSYFIYYTLTFSEDHFADLKAIQLTRFPKALYSALSKIEGYSLALTDPLPQVFYDLYFTGEGVTQLNVPPPQPTIFERKNLLTELDHTLSGFRPKKTIRLRCPFCRSKMTEFTSQSHYGLLIKLDQCPQCGSFWFDKWELWYLADLTSLVLPKEKVALSNQPTSQMALPDDLLCPRCQVKLVPLADPVIPSRIQIWRCPSCQGNLLEKTELAKYQQYRSSKAATLSH